MQYIKQALTLISSIEGVTIVLSVSLHSSVSGSSSLSPPSLLIDSSSNLISISQLPLASANYVNEYVISHCNHRFQDTVPPQFHFWHLSVAVAV